MEHHPAAHWQPRPNTLFHEAFSLSSMGNLLMRRRVPTVPTVPGK
jgi:hypothetical protein